jgi:hypothetical protein
MISISGIYIPLAYAISLICWVYVYVVVREILASGGVKPTDESEASVE